MDKASSIPSDDEPLIKRMERKGKYVLSQGKVDVKGLEETGDERDNLGRNEDYVTHKKVNNDQGFLKRIFGNL